MKKETQITKNFSSFVIIFGFIYLIFLFFVNLLIPNFTFGSWVGTISYAGLILIILSYIIASLPILIKGIKKGKAEYIVGLSDGKKSELNLIFDIIFIIFLIVAILFIIYQTTSNIWIR